MFSSVFRVFQILAISGQHRYKLTKQEQRIIVALVEKPLRRIDIANKLGVKSGAIGASLKTLQNKILIELNNEKYQIYDSIFKTWLKKRI